jgi:hypothetical protein
VDTEIVPVEPPVEPSGPVAAEAAAPPKKKRRGWIIALIVIGVLVVLAIVGFIIADAVAKDYARDYVRSRIVEVLRLPADARVDVDLGGGSIILQALAGRIQNVDVDVPELAFGDLVGAAELHAEGVPLDQNAPVDALRVVFSVDEADVEALAGNLSGLELSSVELEEPEIVVASAFSLFGIEIPVGMSILPSAAEGELVFTPTGISLGDDLYTADEVAANPLFAALAGPLLQQQSVCIADQLPSALVLSAAEVAGERLRLTIDGDGATLGGPGLSTPGTCPAP